MTGAHDREELLEEALSSLGKLREKQVVERIFWNGDAESVIAEEMGISRQRVFQIKRDALRKLRCFIKIAELSVRGMNLSRFQKCRYSFPDGYLERHNLAKVNIIHSYVATKLTGGMRPARATVQGIGGDTFAVFNGVICKVQRIKWGQEIIQVVYDHHGTPFRLSLCSSA